MEDARNRASSAEIFIDHATKGKVHELSDTKSRNQSVGCDSRSDFEEDALDRARH
jgi:hypothetical protein